MKPPVQSLGCEEERKGLFEMEVKTQGFFYGVDPLPGPRERVS